MVESQTEYSLDAEGLWIDCRSAVMADSLMSYIESSGQARTMEEQQ